MKRANKTISIIITLTLFLQQAGFAQGVGELNLMSHFQQWQQGFSQDRFRPLHLRYFYYNPLQDEFRLLVDKGTSRLNEAQVQQETQALLSYFLIGVTLPDEAFWVNLRPDIKEGIIDPRLANTDFGKVLIEADLQLKKDTALATSPKTKEGKEYWDKLYKKAGEIFGSDNVSIPTLTRPWIVPDEVIVREDAGSAYVYKATLKVMLEQDHLKDSAAYSFKDERSRQLNDYSSQLIRELIIPKLTKMVNTSKNYAGLRQVYFSLILARWFKARFSGQGGTYASLINRQDLRGLYSVQDWSVEPYFKEYQKSFKEGEYSLNMPVSSISGQSIRNYFSGGEDFRSLSPHAGFDAFRGQNAGAAPALLAATDGIVFAGGGGASLLTAGALAKVQPPANKPGVVASPARNLDVMEDAERAEILRFFKEQFVSSVTAGVAGEHLIAQHGTRNLWMVFDIKWGESGLHYSEAEAFKYECVTAAQSAGANWESSFVVSGGAASPVTASFDNVSEFAKSISGQYRIQMAPFRRERPSGQGSVVPSYISAAALAQLLSGQFGLPIGGDSDSRIEIHTGAYVYGGKAVGHRWVVIFQGGQPAIYCDGSFWMAGEREPPISILPYATALRDHHLFGIDDAIERSIQDPADRRDAGGFSIETMRRAVASLKANPEQGSLGAELESIPAFAMARQYQEAERIRRGEIDGLTDDVRPQVRQAVDALRQRTPFMIIAFSDLIRGPFTSEQYEQAYVKERKDRGINIPASPDIEVLDWLVREGVLTLDSGQYSVTESGREQIALQDLQRIIRVGRGNMANAVFESEGIDTTHSWWLGLLGEQVTKFAQVLDARQRQTVSEAFQTWYQRYVEENPFGGHPNLLVVKYRTEAYRDEIIKMLSAEAAPEGALSSPATIISQTPEQIRRRIAGYLKAGAEFSLVYSTGARVDGLKVTEIHGEEGFSTDPGQGPDYIQQVFFDDVAFAGTVQEVNFREAALQKIARDAEVKVIFFDHKVKSRVGQTVERGTVKKLFLGEGQPEAIATYLADGLPLNSITSERRNGEGETPLTIVLERSDAQGNPLRQVIYKGPGVLLRLIPASALRNPAVSSPAAPLTINTETGPFSQTVLFPPIGEAVFFQTFASGAISSVPMFYMKAGQGGISVGVNPGGGSLRQIGQFRWEYSSGVSFDGVQFHVDYDKGSFIVRLDDNWRRKQTSAKSFEITTSWEEQADVPGEAISSPAPNNVASLEDRLSSISARIKRREARRSTLERSVTRRGIANSRSQLIELKEIAGELADLENERDDILAEIGEISSRRVPGVMQSGPLSSPDDKGLSPQSAASGVGGIDFRNIPMLIQPMGGFCKLEFNLPQLANPERMQLEEELAQLNRMVDSGIIPSGERLKEYVAACFQKRSAKSELDALIPIVAKVCKLQEENAVAADSSLQEVLVLVDAQ